MDPQRGTGAATERIDRVLPGETGTVAPTLRSPAVGGASLPALTHSQEDGIPVPAMALAPGADPCSHNRSSVFAPLRASHRLPLSIAPAPPGGRATLRTHPAPFRQALRATVPASGSPGDG